MAAPLRCEWSSWSSEKCVCVLPRAYGEQPFREWVENLRRAAPHRLERVYADPDDPQLPVWEAEARWLARDYAGAARLLRKHRKAFLADPRHRWKFYPRLLTSLVRLKRADEACKEAEGLLRGGAEAHNEVGLLLNDFGRGRDPEVLRALLAALETAAHQRGVSTAAMLRLVLRDFLGKVARTG